MAPPVHQAAYTNDLPTLVELVIQKPSLATARDLQGQTPLHHSAYMGHTRVIEYLLTRKGVDIDEVVTPSHCTALWLACYNGQTDAVRTLLLKGADPTIASSDGRTPADVAKQAWWHGQGRVIQRMIKTLGFFMEPEDLDDDDDSLTPCFDVLEEELIVLSQEKKPFRTTRGPLLLTC